MKTLISLSSVLVLAFLGADCGSSQDVEVIRQVTGPGDTNCYLLYDNESREAALFDVGGPVDSLVACIAENDLTLKYVFATHGHMDHMEGVPRIRERFPEVSLCCNREDFDDFLVCREWAQENMDPDELDAMREHPGYRKWFEYDMADFGKPDVYLEDDQVYRLGRQEIRTILSPGHSRGSICFHVGNVLFSGDVLFYRSVGHTSFLGGSAEDLEISMRRLYCRLPDDTIVYPGHGQATDIGSEKTGNSQITMDSAS